MADKAFAPFLGAQLPNGALIIESRPSSYEGRSIVLAITDAGTMRAQYAVWEMDPNTGDCYWGDYFAAWHFPAALKAYNSRWARGIVSGGRTDKDS